MRGIARRLASRAAFVAIGAFVVAGGIAYATIPDANGLYSACRQNTTGALRLIDPSLGPGSPLGRCTPAESELTWNGQGATGPRGPAGPQGETGARGATGAAGQSVTEADAGGNCPNGGLALTTANGTGYVCNGANGADGKDGAGLSSLADLNGLACTDVNGKASTVAGAVLFVQSLPHAGELCP